MIKLFSKVSRPSQGLQDSVKKRQLKGEVGEWFAIRAKLKITDSNPFGN